MPSEMPPLTEWESFYVIVGSSAAALTGLQFVVIALGADAKRLAGEASVRAFATPTIVHFCAVLLLAALLSTPHQTAGSLGLCLAAAGVAGLGYAVWVIAQARRQTHYAPVLSDWVWHAVLPTLGYGLLLVSGILEWRHRAAALYVVAATSLLLLYVGIHNAWDAAVWMAIQRKEK
jgi:hypothetical protein